MFTLTITLGNDVMQTREDIARALDRVAGAVEFVTLDSMSIFDANGNRVGEWSVSE